MNKLGRPKGSKNKLIVYTVPITIKLFGHLAIVGEAEVTGRFIKKRSLDPVKLVSSGENNG